MTESSRKEIEAIDITGLAISYSKVTAAIRVLRGLIAATFYAGIIILPGVIIYVFVNEEKVYEELALSLTLIATGLIIAPSFLILYFTAYRKLMAGSVAWSWGLIVVSFLMVLLFSINSLVEALGFGARYSGGAVLFAIVSWFSFVYLPFILFAGAVEIIRISKVSEKILIHRTPNDLMKDAWLAIGLPEAAHSYSMVTLGALALGLTTFLIEGWVFYAYWGLGEQISKSAETASQLDFTFGYSLGWIIGVRGFALFFIIAHLLFFIGNWVRKKTRRRLQLDARRLMNLDPRPCVLFLRSFNDDQISLKNAKPPWYMRMLDPGSVNSNLEELLVKNYSDIGPVITIGKPTDTIPPLGAARHYLEREDWQSVVRALIREASVVIVGIGSSKGLNWEIDTLVTQGCINKAVFVVPPAFTENHEMLREIISRIDGSLALRKYSKEDVHVLAFTTDSSRSRSIQSRYGPTEIEYDVTFRWLSENIVNRLVGISAQEAG